LEFSFLTAALRKVQEDMKKYADRRRSEVNEYKVGDLVMLSTKDLKYQMVKRRTENVRATGAQDSRRILSYITVCDYDTIHLQENPQRLG